MDHRISRSCWSAGRAHWGRVFPRGAPGDLVAGRSSIGDRDQHGAVDQEGSRHSTPVVPFMEGGCPLHGAVLSTRRDEVEVIGRRYAIGGDLQPTELDDIGTYLTVDGLCPDRAGLAGRIDDETVIGVRNGSDDGACCDVNHRVIEFEGLSRRHPGAVSAHRHQVGRVQRDVRRPANLPGRSVHRDQATLCSGDVVTARIESRLRAGGACQDHRRKARQEPRPGHESGAADAHHDTLFSSSTAIVAPGAPNAGHWSHQVALVTRCLVLHRSDSVFTAQSSAACSLLVGGGLWEAPARGDDLATSPGGCGLGCCGRGGDCPLCAERH